MTDIDSMYITTNNADVFAECVRKYTGGKTMRYSDIFSSKQKTLLIKNVIFNDPATIVFWSDGSKTVVKCQNDESYDPEKGLVMAISKKALGNKGNYYNEIKKWTEPDNDKE